jgi:hypothetical protein
MMMTVDEFLQRVEDHLVASGVAPTRFGITVANDPNFVRDLRAGRVPNLELAGRVIAHIEAARATLNQAASMQEAV